MDEENQSTNTQSYSNMYHSNERDSEIVRFLLEQEAEIQRKIMYYQGYDFDMTQQEYILNQNRKPLINKDGIEFVSRSLRRFLNKNSATANIEFEQLSNIILCFSSEVRLTLVNNMFRFEIQDITTIMEIKNDITDMAFLILTQSIDDKGRDYIHQARRMVESRVLQSSEPQKKGFF
jgi:hypothetical protein